MAGSCMSLKCSDICKCIEIHSTDGSIIINQGGISINDAGNCDWDLSLNPNLTVDITATFDPVTRELCILDKGTINNCVVIPDDDDQTLELNGTILSIHKVDGTLVNSVDLAPILPPQIPFSLTSNSLVVTPGGTQGHSPKVELVPSSDTNNRLILGSDGRPYVPPTTIPTQQTVDIADNDCISWTEQTVGNVKTFTPNVDYQCLADEICDLCKECLPPSIFISDLDFTSFKLYVSNIAAGDTFDVSINGGTTYTYTLQTTSPLVVASLTENSTYQIVVRRNCQGGGTGITALQTINTPTRVVCQDVTNITYTYGAYNFNTGKYPLTISWSAVTGANGYIITNPLDNSPIYTVGTSATFDVLPSTVYSGTIQTACGCCGGNSSLEPYSTSSPQQASCPPPTNLVAIIS